MLRHGGFSPRDWELAPKYESPVTKPGVIILDFGRLAELANAERESGSFRRTDDGTLSRAPLFVDDLPAAFYHVTTTYPDTTPNVNTSRQETLVVMEGILKLVLNDEVKALEEDPGPPSVADTFYTGEVVQLHDRAISMQAIGIADDADCLTLALYRDADVQVFPAAAMRYL